MNIPTAVNVPATTATTTTSTTTTTTTTTADQMQTIPLKFSLMGLPGDIDNIRDFKHLMLKKVKAALANVAYNIGMKRGEVYRVQLTPHSHPNQSKRYIYYTTLKYSRRTQINHMARSSGICALDHETVTVKFSSSDLNPTINRDEFDLELLNIYSRILNDIDGLDLRDITLDRVVENSYGTDVYFNVDVISNGVDWKDVIETELEKEASRQVIINEVSKYTIQTLEEKGEDVQDVNWCFDNQGMFSIACNVHALPLWAIIVIASTAVAILLCILISCCICCRNKREDKKYNVESYVANPELWRQSQIEGKRKRSLPFVNPTRPTMQQRQHVRDDRRHSRRRRSTKERHTKDKRYTRSSHRSKRRSHRRRSSSPDSRRYQRRGSSTRKYEHRDTPHETLSNDVEMQMLALPPPESEPTMLALPALTMHQMMHCIVMMKRSIDLILLKSC
eukprot:scaffold27433_cov53-Cyclotella_meneghiniana.AAC.1